MSDRFFTYYKMKNIYRLLTLSLISITFSNCNQSSSPQHMALSDVEFVNKFPLEFCLQNKIDPNLDIIGINNLVIYDSLMILSRKNPNSLFSIISLSDNKHLGSFLTIGNGPLEFVQPPSVTSDMKLVSEYGQLFAFVYDFQKGKFLKINIDKLINKRETEIVEQANSLPPFIFDFIMVDSTSFFCKEVNSTHTKQLRYLLNNDMRDSTSIMVKLNQSSIKQGEDINILGTSTKMEYEKKIIVEMPISLNHINIYSLDGSWGKTICIGNKLDDIEKIQEKNRWDRIYTFADLRVFPDFFGVVYINEDEKTYQIKRKRLPSILLFDWQGKPLAELKLNHFITSFDIDFINGVLYTFDVHSDELFKYEINDILRKL